MKKLTQKFSQWLLTAFLLAGLQFNSNAQTATHLHFDGVNDYVSLPSSSLFSFGTGDFAVEAWIKTSSNNTQVAVSGVGTGDFWLGTNSGRAGFSVSGTPLIGTTIVNNNQWHHIAGVRQSGILYIYVDGVLDGSLANALSFTPNGTPLAIGSYFNGSAGFLFSGEIDEVRIWNAAQTAVNIAARRNNELAGNESGLLAYYKFNQGIAAGNNTAITTLTNATANPFNGSIINFALTGATSNFLDGSPALPPTPATHLHFDGTNDFVRCGTAFNAAFSSQNTVTMEAWVRSETTTGNGVVAGNFSGADNNIYLQFLIRRDGAHYVFWILNSTNTAYVNVTAANAVAVNTWQHVVGVRNGDQLLIYINGVLVNTTAGVGTHNFTANTGNEFTIGGNARPFSEFFRGDIDEVRVWTTALSAAEIARRKNCELQGNEAGLYAYYKFNQGDAAGTNTAVTTLTNSTATAGLNGTLTSIALTGATSNWVGSSPVITGSTLPSAPSAAAQSFCGTGTVANMVPAPSATINWYNVATGGTVLAGTTALATGTYYVAAVNANGCESGRTAADITVSATTLASVNQNSTLSVSGTTNFPGCTNIIAKLSPNGPSPVSGSTTAKVWIEGTQNPQFVKRHYEITPALNTATATGIITLYFTQAEFDDFNTISAVDLPTGSVDAAGKANLKIEKRSGVSSDGSGLPGTYTGTIATIDPVDADIIWNSTANRWEVSFDVTGFSGFFVKTQSVLLPISLINFTGVKQSNEVLLQWQTNNEINFSRFEVETSTNGYNFELLGNVFAKNAAGINNYLLTDNTSWAVDVRYYRLKLIDNDGRFKYSAVISLSNKLQNGISIYPNPVKDVFTLRVANNKLLHTTAALIDVSGKLIKTIIINNLFQTVDISLVAKGIYLLRFENGSVNKIIKE